MIYKLSIMKIILNPKAILGFIISVGGIYWAFRDFEFRFFYNTLQRINYNYILLAGLLLWSSVYLRALRWKYVFQGSTNPGVSSLYKSQMIGYFGNYVLPLRLGEVLRAYIIGKEWNLSKTYVFGTVILERLLDAISLILLSKTKEQEAAKRECKEEIDCDINKLTKICTYYPAPASSESYYHLFFGEVSSFEGEKIVGQENENEDILARCYSVNEVKKEEGLISIDDTVSSSGSNNSIVTEIIEDLSEKNL